MRVKGSIIITDPVQDASQWGVERSLNGGAYTALPDFEITYVDTGTGELDTRLYAFRYTYTDPGTLVVGNTLRFRFTPNRYDTGAVDPFYYPALGSDPVIITKRMLRNANTSLWLGLGNRI